MYKKSSLFLAATMFALAYSNHTYSCETIHFSEEELNTVKGREDFVQLVTEKIQATKKFKV